MFTRPRTTRLTTLFAAAALTLAGSTVASAQILAERYIVGLDAGINVTKFDERDAAFRLALSPTVLYLLNDNLALGGEVTFGVQDSGPGDAFVVYGLAPAARYYLGDGDDNRWFVDGSLGVRGTSIEGDDPGVSIGFGAGYTIFFNEGLALEPGARFTFLPGDVSGFQFDLSLGLQGFVDALRPGR